MVRQTKHRTSSLDYTEQNWLFADLIAEQIAENRIKEHSQSKKRDFLSHENFVFRLCYSDVFKQTYLSSMSYLQQRMILNLKKKRDKILHQIIFQLC